MVSASCFGVLIEETSGVDMGGDSRALPCRTDNPLRPEKPTRMATGVALRFTLGRAAVSVPPRS